jgi:perosamine synthetase
VYPRHRLDLRPRHLAYAASACLWARHPERIAIEIEEAAPEGALVCFSVRSAFELLLGALSLEAGSQILMSAITHPDMPRIVERHGLVPVPIDLDLDTLQPRTELLERALTPRTRMLVVAHLFGARADIAQAAAFCREHGLSLIEDCAQALRGPDDVGDPRAQAALFSFGSIKTSPALGGAIAYVSDPSLRGRMREIQNAWPRQSRKEYALRVLRFTALIVLARPLVYELFVRAGRRAGIDVDGMVNRSVHALKPPPSEDRDVFGEWLRRRPSAPLLALLRHRLKTFDRDRIRRRTERGERAAQSVPRYLVHPGRAAKDRTHWVFPVACPDPTRAVDIFRAAGFDVTTATTSIAAVPPPDDRADLRPDAAMRFMEEAVFLPVYPELPEPAFRRLVEVMNRLAVAGPVNSAG